MLHLYAATPNRKHATLPAPAAAGTDTGYLLSGGRPVQPRQA